jgi:hypothetical protein
MKATWQFSRVRQVPCFQAAAQFFYTAVVRDGCGRLSAGIFVVEMRKSMNAERFAVRQAEPLA